MFLWLWIERRFNVWYWFLMIFFYWIKLSVKICLKILGLFNLIQPSHASNIQSHFKNVMFLLGFIFTLCASNPHSGGNTYLLDLVEKSLYILTKGWTHLILFWKLFCAMFSLIFISPNKQWWGIVSESFRELSAKVTKKKIRLLFYYAKMGQYRVRVGGCWKIYHKYKKIFLILHAMAIIACVKLK